MPGRGRALRAPRPSCAPFCSRPPPGAGPGPEAPRTKASVPGCGARGAEDGGGTASLLLWSFPEAWRDSGPGGAWIWDHLAGVPKSSRFQGRCGRDGAPGCQAAWARRRRGATSAGLGDTLKGGGLCNFATSSGPEFWLCGERGNSLNSFFTLLMASWKEGSGYDWGSGAPASGL